MALKGEKYVEDNSTDEHVTIVALTGTSAVVGCHDMLLRPLYEQRHMLLVSQVWTACTWPLYVKGCKCPPDCTHVRVHDMAIE